MKWALLMGGERVLLYQRKWTGTRCPNWDQVRKQHVLDNTTDVCYGTGWVGGYYRPIEIYVSLRSSVALQNVVQEEGIRKMYRPTSWTLWEPRIQNSDFVVFQDGRRMWINNVTYTRWKGQILRQLFETEEVERNHPIYKIPV